MATYLHYIKKKPFIPTAVLLGVGILIFACNADLCLLLDQSVWKPVLITDMSVRNSKKGQSFSLLNTSKFLVTIKEAMNIYWERPALNQEILQVNSSLSL